MIRTINKLDLSRYDMNHLRQGLRHTQALRILIESKDKELEKRTESFQEILEKEIKARLGK